VSPPVSSPLLLAILRALVFVGLTEAIFYRLLPAPSRLAFQSALDRMHDSVDRAGSLTFILAYLLVTLGLLVVAHRSLRVRLWPAGLNGFLVVCLVCLSGLALAALVSAPGPLFALAFSSLTLVAFFFAAMHSFTMEKSRRARAFTVAYSAALLCSMAGTFAGLGPALPGGLRDRFNAWAEASLGAGSVLLSAAACFAYMAFADFGRSRHRVGGMRWMALGIAAAAALGLAAGSTLAPPRLALLGWNPAPWEVILLSFTVFVSTLTALLSLLEPVTRLTGYGLLLLVLAGYPLMIAHQHLLAVLGSMLIFAPRRARSARIPISILSEGSLTPVRREELP